MAKALSPVRLQSELMQAATVAGVRMRRSAPEQVEYWASLGRQIAASLISKPCLRLGLGWHVV